MKQIKIFCLGQPLRFRTKNLIRSVAKQQIKFAYAHFITYSLFKNNESP